MSFVFKLKAIFKKTDKLIGFTGSEKDKEKKYIVFFILKNAELGGIRISPLPTRRKVSQKLCATHFLRNGNCRAKRGRFFQQKKVCQCYFFYS